MDESTIEETIKTHCNTKDDVDMLWFFDTFKWYCFLNPRITTHWSWYHLTYYLENRQFWESPKDIYLKYDSLTRERIQQKN